MTTYFSILKGIAYALKLTNDINQAKSVFFSALNNRTRKMLGNLLNADEQAKIMLQMEEIQAKSTKISANLLSSVKTLSQANPYPERKTAESC